MTQRPQLPASGDAARGLPGRLCWGTTLLVTLIAVLVSGCTASPGQNRAASSTRSGTTSPTPSGTSSSSQDEVPALPEKGGPTVAAVCRDRAQGPAEAPANAVRIDPSVRGDLAVKSGAAPAGTTFWLAPGVHRLEDYEYAQVAPKAGNTYLGAPGAVVDGAGVNRYAFTGKAAGVTIKYLTVKGFVPPPDEGVVNHDSGADWVIEDNTITDNRGAGMMAGPRQIMRGNCLKDNGQYGLNACCGSLVDLQLVGNEFVGNNADDLERKKPGCGCTGGMKLWAVDGADIRGNWIHGNHGPGIWADTNNNDFLIEGNLIEGNDDPAIFYETSYNAIIRNNLLRRNNLLEGKDYARRGDGFPVATIYVSESGGEPRVRARTDKIEIYGNVLEDNWGGITLWENADRYCNSPNNTSTGVCTLLVKDVSQCRQPAIKTAPLFGDCRWKTQRVVIHGNRFSVNPQAIGCASGLCARMAVLSNFGTSPDWSPYKGNVISEAITLHQANRWYGNTYTGPWTFVFHDASRAATLDEWRAAPYRQDQGSTFASAGNTSLGAPA
jgi:Right handed beta helix region